MNSETETKIKTLLAKIPNVVYSVDEKVNAYEDIVSTLLKYKRYKKIPIKYRETVIKDIFNFHIDTIEDNLIVFDSCNLDNSFIISKIIGKEYYVKISKIPNNTYNSLIAIYT